MTLIIQVVKVFRIHLYLNNITGFINQSELSDAMKHLFDTETDVDQTYIEELISAMALNKNGKVNFNEFLGKP